QLAGVQDLVGLGQAPQTGVDDLEDLPGAGLERHDRERAGREGVGGADHQLAAAKRVHAHVVDRDVEDGPVAAQEAPGGEGEVLDPLVAGEALVQVAGIDGPHAHAVAAQDAGPASGGGAEVDGPPALGQLETELADRLLELELGARDLVGAPGQAHAAPGPVTEAVAGLVEAQEDATFGETAREDVRPTGPGDLVAVSAQAVGHGGEDLGGTEAVV